MKELLEKAIQDARSLENNLKTALDSCKDFDDKAVIANELHHAYVTIMVLEKLKKLKFPQ